MTNEMENGNLKALSKLKTAIENSHRIVVLTGAGASVPSGIPDFRSAHGLYATSFGKYPAETVISHDFFMMHPKEFYDFYKSKMVYPDAKPNAMHALLARLEKSGKIEGIVTQNIDGLHQAAGSKKVFELHGSIWRNRCERCRKFFDLDYILSKEGVPHCDECGGIIKPEVVLYGENLDEDVLRGAIRSIQRADMLIVVGTSLVVYPAAGLVGYFCGNVTAVINKSSTYFDSQADVLLNADCREVATWLDKNLTI